MRHPATHTRTCATTCVPSFFLPFLGWGCVPLTTCNRLRVCTHMEYLAHVRVTQEQRARGAGAVRRRTLGELHTCLVFECVRVCGADWCSGTAAAAPYWQASTP